MTEELEPCPFCGSAAKVRYAEDAMGAVVRCRWGCASTALHLWNTRPVEDELRKRVAELEAMIDNDENAHFEALAKELGK